MAIPTFVKPWTPARDLFQQHNQVRNSFSQVTLTRVCGRLISALLCADNSHGSGVNNNWSDLTAGRTGRMPGEAILAFIRQ